MKPVPDLLQNQGLPLLNLEDDRGAGVQLYVRGYEFRSLPPKDLHDDGDWLEVLIAAYTPDHGHWQTLQPCLETTEIQKLHDHFGAALTSGAPPLPRPGILEPALDVYLNKAEAGWALSVQLAHGAAPPTKPSIHSVIMHFYVTATEVEGIRSNLRRILQHFPTRSRSWTNGDDQTTRPISQEELLARAQEDFKAFNARRSSQKERGVSSFNVGSISEERPVLKDSHKEEAEE